jgi:hypothetical protein
MIARILLLIASAAFAIVVCWKIHAVEVFPFVTIPYVLGYGWTPGSGR